MTCKHKPVPSRNIYLNKCKLCGAVYESEYSKSLRIRKRQRIDNLRQGWKEYCNSQEQDPVDTTQYGLGWPRT